MNSPSMSVARVCMRGFSQDEQSQYNYSSHSTTTAVTVQLQLKGASGGDPALAPLYSTWQHQPCHVTSDQVPICKVDPNRTAEV